MPHHEKEYLRLSVEEPYKNNKYDEKTGFNLYFSALSASLFTFGMGTVTVWTSPVVSRLRSDDPDVNPLGKAITTYQESILGGLGFIGACIGSLILANLSDILGRRRTLLILSTIMLFADLALAFANQLIIYYISRFVLSLCIGGGCSALAIFLSEITENHNRGKIGALIGLSSPMGSLFVYVTGPMFNIRSFTLFCAVPYAILIFNFVFFVHESPVYLASKGRRNEAIKALEQLRDKTASEIEEEYDIIMKTWNTTTKGSSNDKEFLENKALKKGLVIALVLNTIQQLSGVTAILAFAGPLFDSAKMKITGNTTAILIGMIKVISVSCTMFIVDKIGKRPLLLTSTFGCGSAHLILGLFFYLRSIDCQWIIHVLWLPIPTILLNFVFYSIGMGAITPSMTSELFPSNNKAFPVALSNFTGFVIGVVMIMIFPVFIRSLGPMWCIWGFSFSCFAGCIFIYFMVPEIKGKSVMEIMEILSR